MRERGAVREQLAAARAHRVRPGLDDKVLVSWNGLAIGALAEAGAVFGRADWIAAAERTSAFIATSLVGTDDDGREVLWHRWTPEHGAGIAAFAEDVAYLAQGLVTLYEADHDARWLQWAQRLADDADTRFRDASDHTYFTTPVDGEQLIARPRELLDNATPATSSVMTDVHLRLGALTGAPLHTRRAEQTLTTLAGAARQMPLAFGELLRALERYVGAQTEVAVVGAPVAERDALVAAYREQWRPSAVLAVGDAGQTDAAPPVALLADRPLRDGRATAYVCHDFACEQPVTEPDALRAQLAHVTAGDRGA